MNLSQLATRMESHDSDDPAIVVTGGEENLVYCKPLGYGGYGTVHMVLNPISIISSPH